MSFLTADRRHHFVHVGASMDICLPVKHTCTSLSMYSQIIVLDSSYDLSLVHIIKD